jgi:putative ABC transport system ATP-binding protein
VVAVDLVKTYGSGEAAVTALGGVSASFTAGRFSAIMGASGWGKSTLLHCLAGLDTVDSGKVLIGDTDITPLKDRQLTRLRRSAIGFVFQSFHLLPP